MFLLETERIKEQLSQIEGQLKIAEEELEQAEGNYEK